MPKFLDFIGMVIIPPSQLIHNWQPMLSRDYLSRMHDEHKNIAEAINKGDIEASRQAMRLHLTESLKRYKALR